MEDTKKICSNTSLASMHTAYSTLSEPIEKEDMTVDSKASTAEAAENEKEDDFSLHSIEIGLPTTSGSCGKAQGSKISASEKTISGSGEENLDACDTVNFTISSSNDGDAHFYNTKTLEKPPQMAHYRLSLVNELKRGRASMPQLMRSTDCFEDTDSMRNSMDNGLRPFTSSVRRVFIPSYTNICGTLLYLRMGYVAGQAGILGGIGIVLFSTFIIFVTALSMIAVCSNGKQLGAGIYYIFSRSLGPQFGGVIGVIFSLANVGMAALYIVGISEFVRDLQTEKGYGFVTLSRMDDIRLYSLVICIIFMLIAFAGPDISNAFTFVFTLTYFISFLNWIVGTFLPVSEHKFIRGVTGYNWITVKMNMLPDFRDGQSFVSIFAVFFPGFTGMLAGTMYIDQLKNPNRDIPIGIFTSLVTTAGMYLVAVIACSATMLRDASGTEIPYIDNATGLWHIPQCTANESCRYGLMNYFGVAELTSAWLPLTIIGMFGMSTSSLMTNLDQGPQTFHAACKDGIFPYLRYFAKEYGKHNFPRRAWLLLAFFTIVLSLIGDLDAISNIVTNMFMATYALVNYACFDASFLGSPGWRPQFKYYSQWISFLGAAICVAVMFTVSLNSSLMICFIFAVCFAYFHYAQTEFSEVNWGDTRNAHAYRKALGNLGKVTSLGEHVKDYRPQILLLSGNPASRVPLVDFAHSITKGESLLVCGHVVQYAPNSCIFTAANRLKNEIERWLRKNKISAFYQNVANENMRIGALSMLQLSGLGRLRPNVVLLGFKSDWMRAGQTIVDEVEDYVRMLRDAFANDYGVAILRDNGRGFDLSEEFVKLGIRDIDALKKAFASIPKNNGSLKNGSQLNYTINILSKFNPQATVQGNDRKKSKFFSDRYLLEAFDENDEKEETNMAFGNGFDTVLGRNTFSSTITSHTILCQQKNVATRSKRSRIEHFAFSQKIRRRLEKEFQSIESLGKRMNAFCRKQKGGTKRRIDVWWLYDDGGLTLLIPHLLRLPKSYLEGAELRILTLSGNAKEVNEQSMTALLEKFRIEFNSVKVIDADSQKLNPDITEKFNKISQKWMKSEANYDAGLISDEELVLHKDRTHRHMLTHQMLTQHSFDASLVVVTLPVPREDVRSGLYMTWLELITSGLPPCLLVRGNQTSVLTFYS
ncbi:solute carrier family 12 domain-containing protein [Ditylenchus destructor]|uniref:Solute carrier family 12 member 9 n=1 Tax=Ditylenchus destructor TaxID=166010 RepID=A0AAD4MPE5_9BILA|nr:solute carrier family 12 domain-containing protein [Ditylenchus destructor]